MRLSRWRRRAAEGLRAHRPRVRTGSNVPKPQETPRIEDWPFGIGGSVALVSPAFLLIVAG